MELRVFGTELRVFGTELRGLCTGAIPYNFPLTILPFQKFLVTLYPKIKFETIKT